MQNKILITVVGPTAVGKTEFAIRLAEHYHTEIVSADSRQFYREMEIGTAKPTPEELKIPHHFINNLSIHYEYNVGKYEKEALQCITELFKKHDKVVLVGGSGLFVNAVCDGLDTLPEGDEELREKYEDILKNQGIEVLQKELEKVDTDYFAVVDKKNPRRIIRALEVYHQTGKPFSTFRNKQPAARDFTAIKIGLNIQKEKLLERINKRIDNMLTTGWLEECKALYAYRQLNALKTVGYSELFDYLEGKYDWTTTVQHIKTNTWHYAKRQLTWLKKDKAITWFAPSDLANVYKCIDNLPLKN